MENETLNELCELASLRIRSREQKVQFSETIQKVLMGSHFFEVLREFSSDERIEVEYCHLRSATRSRLTRSLPCTAS